MGSRRWVLPFVLPLLRFPYASAVLGTYALVRLSPSLGPKATLYGLLVMSLAAALAFLSVPRPVQGKLGRRRQMEGALAVLTAIDLVARGSSYSWVSFLSFPTFILFIYGGYQWPQLLTLLLVDLAFRWFRLGGAGGLWEGVFQPFGLLTVWTALAIGYRWHERQERRGMSDRLRLYEREASSLAFHSEDVQSTLRVEDKKKVHLASMIRDREASFRDSLEIVEGTFRPHTVAFYFFDAREEIFILKEVITESDRFNEERVQRPEGIFRAILREAQPVRLASPLGTLRGLNYYDGPPMVRSVLALPLLSNGLLKGALILDRLDPKGFDEIEIQTAQKVGDQIVRTMESGEALHAYFHLQEELTQFYNASSELNRSLKTDDVVRTLIRSTQEIAQYDWGVVVLYDATTDLLTVAAQEGDFVEDLVGKTMPCVPQKGLVSWVIRNGAPLAYTHFRSRESKTPLLQGVRVPNVFDSLVIAPLRMNDESLGAAIFASRQNEFFSKSVRKMVEVIALQASAALKNSRMVGELERLATTDGLTGLLNHRTFQEELIQELERSARHPTSTSLLLVDVDHFKRFNDEYGHPIGDFVLKEISKVLKKAVRKVDLVARYGGEEFAVVLVNTPSSGAKHMADRIVSEVAHTKLETQGLRLHVMVSVGVATIPDDAISREDLIEFADRALYESKRTGRNRATVYHPSLGKMNPEVREQKLIRTAEAELLHSVDPRTRAV